MDKKTKNISMAIGGTVLAGALAYLAMPREKREELNIWFNEKLIEEPMERLEKIKK